MGQKLLDEVTSWHKVRGFRTTGYHYLIDREGTLIPTYRGLEEVPAAQEGNNTGSIAICLDGLKQSDFNEKQFATLRELADAIDAAYSGLVHYHGHCEVANKACPVFDYKMVLNLNPKGFRVKGDAGNISVPPNHQKMESKRYYPNGSRLLHKTSQGKDVAWVQKNLGIDDDGLFGKDTFDAVVKFQQEQGLDDDGVIGKDTWKALIAAFPNK
jgi:N-acetyl-anhydromuramyl-L-alanine amidase AmpD